MSVEKLIKKGEDDKKSINKSFRLRLATGEFLENISKKTSLSQNEIVNSLIDDAGETLNIAVVLGEKLNGLYKNHTAILWKNINDIFLFVFLISVESKEGIKCHFQLVEVLEENRLPVYNKTFPLKSFDDIIKLGIDSSYSLEFKKK